MKKKIKIISIIAMVLLIGGWGRVGHEIINSSTPQFFPKEMNEFVAWKDFLAAHASDADNRKGSDPNESPKHFIDIDAYPEFVSNGRISQSLDTMITEHGEPTVYKNGVLPWAIINSVDSLTAQFKRRDWDKAKQTAADLGHYVGDSHMPLHLTENYNGQLSNQYGVHSRYESSMVGKYENQFTYTGDTCYYVNNIPDFVFNYIYANYAYKDSVLDADIKAASFAGGSTKSDAYYQKLYELTGDFTLKLFKSASQKLASLIYTAWIDAGKPSLSTTGVKSENIVPKKFKLYQNYPNPFNPSTKIQYSITTNNGPVPVSLKLYDILGKQLVTLVNENKSSGDYEVEFNGSKQGVNIPSGVYLYTLSVGNFNETKKLVLLK